MDETYVKVRGEWCYLYRAVDGQGRMVGFWLSKRRGVQAAKCFLRHALREHGDPLSITLDAYAAWHRAIHELKDSGEIFYQKMRVRSCAHLNNVVEQDHRRVKQRLYPMLGFKGFENARVVIGAIELAQKIRKRQFDLRQLGGAHASDAEK
jgi:transposase-like protein